jgi:hypothetical protein
VVDRLAAVRVVASTNRLDMGNSSLRLLVVSACAILLCNQSVDAHDIALSAIRIIYRPDDVLVSVSIHLSELAKSENADLSRMTDAGLDLAIRKRVHLRFDGKDSAFGKAFVIRDSASDHLTWQVVADRSANKSNAAKSFDESSECEVLSRLCPEQQNSSTIVSIIRDGQAVHEELLDRQHPAFLKPIEPQLVAWRYLQAGFDHIVSGPDHIVFLVGLLLPGGSILSLFRTVTAFTIAHSLTLSLAATGSFVPSSRLVEPLIALSIVAIAVENLRALHLGDASESKIKSHAPRDWRPLAAFAFGLVHGFGFAGALLEVGLPVQSLWIALASFNLGVEFGQASIVVCLAPIILFARRKNSRIYLKFARVFSVLIALIGAVWFAARM